MEIHWPARASRCERTRGYKRPPGLQSTARRQGHVAQRASAESNPLAGRIGISETSSRAILVYILIRRLKCGLLRKQVGGALLRRSCDLIEIAPRNFFLLNGIGALQIMLDKGQEDDWFSSTFIWHAGDHCGCA
jgi:hypothetical protein